MYPSNCLDIAEYMNTPVIKNRNVTLKRSCGEIASLMQVFCLAIISVLYYIVLY